MESSDPKILLTSKALLNSNLTVLPKYSAKLVHIYFKDCLGMTRYTCTLKKKLLEAHISDKCDKSHVIN